ncbi:MAG: hypothetical protein IT436_16765 [Phycisphaerales bacterium]|nr:hypothetical protein [Phycisphaerales bacterium]
MTSPPPPPPAPTPPPSDPHGDDDSLDAAGARRHLRSTTEALLRFDDLTLHLRFILDPATGDPVSPIPPAVLTAAELILFIPDEVEDALQLLVHPVEINPDREAAADRWLIYHGASRESRWARLEIQSARRGRDVFDGPDLRGPAHLLKDEPRLLALLNADAPGLARLCRSATGTAPADPRAVGIDPDGLDIRARFGIIRIPFDRPADSPAAAESLIRGLISGAGA